MGWSGQAAGCVALTAAQLAGFLLAAAYLLRRLQGLPLYYV